MEKATKPTRSTVRRLSASMVTVGVVLLAAVGCTFSAPSTEATSTSNPDVSVAASPENVVLGGFPIDRAAVATVKPGEVVQVDTIQSSGITNPAMTPAEYFAQFGVDSDELLEDQLNFWDTLDEHPAYGPHTVTGPIDVEGANPGDTLMIEILDVDTRTHFGFNYTGSDTGVFSKTYPGYRDGDAPLDIAVTSEGAFSYHASPGEGTHLIRTGIAEDGIHEGQEVAFFDEDTQVPLNPFFGVMSTKPADGQYVGISEGAPPYETGVQSSIPPGSFGGNLDTRDYVAGTTLYLPVNQPGAGVYLGDGHSAQGDGEVSGTAIEQSLSGKFRFTVLKDRPSSEPSGETPDFFLVHGIDHDLQRALKIAVGNTVEFLERTKGLSTARAYSLTSISVSYSVSEAVDGTQIVTARIPKSLWGQVGDAELTDTARLALEPHSALTVPGAG